MGRSFPPSGMRQPKPIHPGHFRNVMWIETVGYPMRARRYSAGQGLPRAGFRSAHHDPPAQTIADRYRKSIFQILA